MKFAVILVHYYTPQLLVKAVAALRVELDAIGLPAEILIVDNGSKPTDRPLIESLPARYLDAGSNLGYAGGVNLGVAQTKADFLFLMNPDVIIFPGCLASL